MEPTTYLGIPVIEEEFDFSPDWLIYERNRRGHLKGEPLFDLDEFELSPEARATVENELSKFQENMEQSYKDLCAVRESLAVAVRRVEPQSARRKKAVSVLKDMYASKDIIPSKDEVRFLLSGI